MPAFVEYRCPHCNERNNVPRDKVGSMIECIICNDPFTATPPQAKPIEPTNTTHKPKKPRPLWEKIFITCFFAAIALFAIKVYFTPETPDFEQTMKRHQAQTGGDIRRVKLDRAALFFPTQEKMDIYMRNQGANSDVWAIGSNCQVKVLGADGDRVRVEVLDGSHKGKHGWMLASQLE